MGKLICLMGKSASGKDTLFRMIKKTPFLRIEPVVPFTTRPKRTGEKDGVDYCFVSQKEMESLEQDGKILEKRTYNTIKGEWHYFTPLIDLNGSEFKIIITTPEAFNKILKHYSREQLIVIILQASDTERFKRSFKRERKQPEPNYQEICRRFLADEKDFKNVDFSSTHEQFVLNANKSFLNSYLEFLTIFLAIKKNKADKYKKKPEVSGKNDILLKCEQYLKYEKTKKNDEAEFNKCFEL